MNIQDEIKLGKQRLIDKLESTAVNVAYENTDMAQLSIAVSLKRIADMMEYEMIRKYGNGYGNNDDN